ncbi:MAG: hypothetical protein GH158_03425 [Dehalococcoidia bacterium]|nr:hypothetical protein [Dehalococcoidia bacterium]
MNTIIKEIMGSTLRRYFIIALVASLVVTSGMFAYAYTSSVATITGSSEDSDFATVTTNTTGNPGTFSVWGSYRGSIGSGTLFEIAPGTNYLGDVTVNVYLSNVDQLSYKYGMLLMRLAFIDPDNPTDEQDVEMIEKPLTLNNGVVSFTCDNFTLEHYEVVLRGGVYRTFPWAYLTNQGSGSFTPQVTVEVLQAGL